MCGGVESTCNRGRLHSCCDVDFCSITNLYFPGDQKPFWKASFASFPPRSSGLKISYCFKILTFVILINIDISDLCVPAVIFLNGSGTWRALCQRLQTSYHPVVISDVAISVGVLPDCTV